MSVPSIKGMGTQNSLRDLARLVDLGKLQEGDLDHRLDATARAMLENRVEETFWYPVSTADQILTLLRDLLGHGDNRWLVEYGDSNAGRLLENPTLAKLVEGSRALGPRAGVALVKISSLLFNFGEWRYEGADLRDFTVTVTDAAHLPESIRWNTQGFIQHLASRTLGEPVVCTSERHELSRITYRGLLQLRQ